MNIHCFFDKNEGDWKILPLRWELYSPLIANEVKEIQTIFPQWKNPAEVLATLRSANYNPDLTIDVYGATCLEDDEKAAQKSGSSGGGGKSSANAAAALSMPGGGLSREKSVVMQSLTVNTVNANNVQLVCNCYW